MLLGKTRSWERDAKSELLECSPLYVMIITLPVTIFPSGYKCTFQKVTPYGVDYSKAYKNYSVQRIERRSNRADH